MSGLIVTAKHLVSLPGLTEKPGLCIPKSREWAKRHGFDFRDFLRNGIAADTLLATGDAFALKLVEWARECEGMTDGR